MSSQWRDCLLKPLLNEPWETASECVSLHTLTQILTVAKYSFKKNLNSLPAGEREIEREKGGRREEGRERSVNRQERKKEKIVSIYHLSVLQVNDIENQRDQTVLRENYSCHIKFKTRGCYKMFLFGSCFSVPMHEVSKHSPSVIFEASLVQKW